MFYVTFCETHSHSQIVSFAQLNRMKSFSAMRNVYVNRLTSGRRQISCGIQIFASPIFHMIDFYRCEHWTVTTNNSCSSINSRWKIHDSHSVHNMCEYVSCLQLNRWYIHHWTCVKNILTMILSILIDVLTLWLWHVILNDTNDERPSTTQL